MAQGMARRAAVAHAGSPPTPNPCRWRSQMPNGRPGRLQWAQPSAKRPDRAAAVADLDRTSRGPGRCNDPRRECARCLQRCNDLRRACATCPAPLQTPRRTVRLAACTVANAMVLGATYLLQRCKRRAHSRRRQLHRYQGHGARLAALVARPRASLGRLRARISAAPAGISSGPGGGRRCRSASSDLSGVFGMYTSSGNMPPLPSSRMRVFRPCSQSRPGARAHIGFSATGR